LRDRFLEGAISLSLVVDEHREYLSDQARISAFSRAISEVVKPGDVVLDLGSGTGILGLFACRAGAKKVYSIDDGGMVGLARQICQVNGLQDRVVFIKGLSTRVDLPEKVDVIVADQIGHFGFNAGLLEYFSDARERFLKPGGTMVPCGIELLVAPVESHAMRNQVEFWDHSPAGFDFSPARSLAVNTGYPAKFQPEALLGAPARLISLNLANVTSSSFKMTGCVAASRNGCLHGVGGWFSVYLCPNVTMTNSPLAVDSINRRNIFFPIDRPVDVVKGDCVRIAMHIVPTETMVTWKVEIWNEKNGDQSDKGRVCKASFKHSTFKGLLLCEEDLQRTRPGFVPKLTPWGDARLSVLTLCDGQQPLAEVEQEVFRRHPKLFRSPQEAATFVAEVVTRYSQ
jgi:ribosomal protein L11 methyltransferase PrmA/PRMT5 arginine-N-methyltransferase